MGRAEVSVLVEVLKDHGYRVMLNHAVVGESGIEHEFDVVAVRGDESLFFNFAGDDVEVSYLSMVGTYMDLRGDGRRFFVVASSDAVQGISELHGEVDLLPYSSAEELEAKLRELLERSTA